MMATEHVELTESDAESLEALIRADMREHLALKDEADRGSFDALKRRAWLRLMIDSRYDEYQFLTDWPKTVAHEEPA